MQPEQQIAETPTLSADDQQAELDRLMAQYNTPAKTIEVPVSSQEQPKEVAALTVNVDTQTVPTIQPVNNVDPNAPYGYFQRGKKKGQPRTTPYVNAKGVSSIPVVQQPLKPVEPPKLSGMLISGGLFLMLVNLCLPLFFAVANNFFSKDKLNPDNLKLTKDQIKELDPVCDEAMKRASVTGNPLLLLILGICTAMGMNYMMWKMKQQLETKKPDAK